MHYGDMQLVSMLLLLLVHLRNRNITSVHMLNSNDHNSHVAHIFVFVMQLPD